jgi:dolichyl-phosphate beta-glucosyltransferase
MVNPEIDLNPYNTNLYLLPSTEIEVPEISLILPAFNEGTRQEGNSEMGYAFRAALDTYSTYLESRFGNDNNWELIVVDDGSTDKQDPGSTQRIAREHGAKVLDNPNGATSRRGGALKIGYLKSNGMVRIYTDSDGSYSPKTIDQLYENIENGNSDVSVAYRSEEEKQFDKLIRKYGHNIIHRICESKHMAPTGVIDPQAGAKAFSAISAVNVWSRVTSNGWAADREALVIARLLDYRVSQVSANIDPHEGSSVRILSDTLKMIRDSLEIGMTHYEIEKYQATKKVARFGLGKSITIAEKIEDIVAAKNKKSA